jgi:hypothetical protein
LCYEQAIACPLDVLLNGMDLRAQLLSDLVHSASWV